MLSQMRAIEARGHAGRLANEYRNLALCARSLIDNNRQHDDVLRLCAQDLVAGELLENCLHETGDLPALSCPQLFRRQDNPKNTASRV